MRNIAVIRCKHRFVAVITKEKKAQKIKVGASCKLFIIIGMRQVKCGEIITAI